MDTTTPQPKKVALCGCGVIGVCTAYFLSRKGASVTLIEQSSVACAASGKAGGFLALDWCDGGPVASLARASFNLHRSLAQELNGSESYGYRPLTTLSVSVTESSSSSSSSSNRTGPVPSWVDGPVKSPRTIGSTDSTAQVHPELFTKTLLSKAMEDYGVELVIGKADRLEMAEGKPEELYWKMEERLVLMQLCWHLDHGVRDFLFWARFSEFMELRPIV